MLILDTCALIFDSLSPERLSAKAAAAIEQGYVSGELACSDISLWEIAMMISKKRIDPQTDVSTYIQLVLTARKIRVLPITPEIAAKSVEPGIYSHGDPADRIIASTAIIERAPLITSDSKLSTLNGLTIIW